MRAFTTMTAALSALATLSSAERKTYTADDLLNVTSSAVDDLESDDKVSWCQGQFEVCRQLCDRTDTNTCDNSSLEYECECNNGTAPGLQYYDSSMSTYLCLAVFTACNADHASDSRAQDECREVRDRDCPPGDMLNAFDASDDDDDDDSATTTSSASDSDSTDDASATTDSDSSDATDSADSEESEEDDEDDEDDSLAAPTTAPFVGAAAMAVAMLVYLI